MDYKPRGGQLAKMAAGSWWRYAGGISKLCRGERSPAKQRDEHIGARRIADQCGDFRDLRPHCWRARRRACRLDDGP